MATQAKIQAKTQAKTGERPSLTEVLEANIARYETRREDWDVFGFETKKDPKFARAQRRYIGASGSTSHIDANTVAGNAHTLSIMMMPPGHTQPLHAHEVDEVFFILEGSCTLIWEKGDERIERILGKWDMASSPPGYPHSIHNHTVEPLYFQVMLAKPQPNRPAYIDPEIRKLQKEADTG